MGRMGVVPPERTEIIQENQDQKAQKIFSLSLYLAWLLSIICCKNEIFGLVPYHAIYILYIYSVPHIYSRSLTLWLSGLTIDWQIFLIVQFTDQYHIILGSRVTISWMVVRCQTMPILFDSIYIHILILWCWIFHNIFMNIYARSFHLHIYKGVFSFNPQINALYDQFCVVYKWHMTIIYWYFSTYPHWHISEYIHWVHIHIN